jgi:hypothetical protein
VFVIVGENTQLSQLNMGNAPYLLGTLKPASAWLTYYFATTHYSEANYVAMTSGQFTECQQNDGPAASCLQNVPSLFQDLALAGDTFTTWPESMPAPCFLVNAGGDAAQNHYAAKHSPQLFFDNVEGDTLGGSWLDNGLNQGGAFCTATNIPAGSATAGTWPSRPGDPRSTPPYTPEGRSPITASCARSRTASVSSRPRSATWEPRGIQQPCRSTRSGTSPGEQQFPGVAISIRGGELSDRAGGHASPRNHYSFFPCSRTDPGRQR